MSEEKTSQEVVEEFTPPEAPVYSPIVDGDELTDEQARQELVGELDRLIDRLKEAVPEYSPPPFSPRRFIAALHENLGRYSPKMGFGFLERLRSGITEDLLDIDTWKGIWYVVNYSLESQTDTFRRRMSGEYETDEWGFDAEVLDAVRPFVEFLYNRYWRVEAIGLENVPDEGRAMLVCNHSGQLPWDGLMLGTALYSKHPAQRLVRTLYGAWLPRLPFISDMFTKIGQVLASVDNGVRLLEQDELIAVFPEGYKGVGKLFKNRYRLARFGGGDFVHMALKTGAPMIPVAVVGAEETYLSLANSPTMAKMMGFPYFPISPTFPWLGMVGFVPLPTKWTIEFAEPIEVQEYGPDASENLALVSQLTDQARNVVQNMIYNRLAQRRSIFFG